MECTQSCLAKVSTKTCNQFNIKVDRCNDVKIKEIDMEYDDCFKEVRQNFIHEKCETIKSKYVPLGLGGVQPCDLLYYLLGDTERQERK